jgi:hypothetical protein
VLRFTWLAVLVALAACDNAVDAGYQGTPLYQLTGTVRSDRDVGSARIALLWVNPLAPASHDTSDALPVDVEGVFPSHFELPIYVPPRAGVLVDLARGTVADEPAVGFAYLLVYSQGWEDYFDRRGLLGASPDRMVVYVSGEVKPGSATARFLHGTPTRGYHLVEVRALPVPANACNRVEGCADVRGELWLLPDEDTVPPVELTIPAYGSDVALPTLVVE